MRPPDAKVYYLTNNRMSEPKYPLDLRPQDEEMYRRGWNDARAEIERLRTERDDAREQRRKWHEASVADRTALAEAAAILDKMVERMERDYPFASVLDALAERFSYLGSPDDAADCRALARQLRGEPK